MKKLHCSGLILISMALESQRQKKELFTFGDDIVRSNGREIQPQLFDIPSAKRFKVFKYTVCAF